MKGCLISCIVREMNIKTILIAFLTKLTKIKLDNPLYGEAGGVGANIILYIAGGIENDHNKREISKINNPQSTP